MVERDGMVALDTLEKGPWYLKEIGKETTKNQCGTA